MSAFASPGADRRRWIGLAVILTAQFMVVLDVAIVNVALPTSRPTFTSARRTCRAS